MARSDPRRQPPDPTTRSTLLFRRRGRTGGPTIWRGSCGARPRRWTSRLLRRRPGRWLRRRRTRPRHDGDSGALGPLLRRAQLSAERACLPWSPKTCDSARPTGPAATPGVSRCDSTTTPARNVARARMRATRRGPFPSATGPLWRRSLSARARPADLARVPFVTRLRRRNLEKVDPVHRSRLPSRHADRVAPGSSEKVRADRGRNGACRRPSARWAGPHRRPRSPASDLVLLDVTHVGAHLLLDSSSAAGSTAGGRPG